MENCRWEAVTGVKMFHPGVATSVVHCSRYTAGIVMYRQSLLPCRKPGAVCNNWRTAAETGRTGFEVAHVTVRLRRSIFRLMELLGKCCSRAVVDIEPEVLFRLIRGGHRCNSIALLTFDHSIELRFQVWREDRTRFLKW